MSAFDQSVGSKWLCHFWLYLFLGLGSFVITFAVTEETSDQRDLRSDFQAFVELAPFEVVDQHLTISVFARSKADRRYAESFAEEVVDITYATLGKSTGYGLVIVGDETEPHPMFVYKIFLRMAREKRIRMELVPSADELERMIQEWEDKVEFDERDGGGEDGIDIEFETLVPALPLPLEGVASKLYQIAWVEAFDERRVEQRLEALTLEELESDELSFYDWVFFLPHRAAFSKVLDEVIPIYMEQKKVNIFQAAAIRVAVFTFKPLMKGAFERIRKGMLYMTLLRAVSDYSESDIEALLETYIKALRFDGKARGQSEREFVIEKIEAQKIENAWFAAHPFVPPEPLATFDPAAYKKFEGKYARRSKASHRFFIKNGKTYWHFLDREPRLFFPAGEYLFVSEDKSMTIRFLNDEAGNISGVEQRWEDRRNIVSRKL
ncbi:MAG: hypothetical protein O3C43_20700 [Verrucomicrobia bacterium]|nr:hypothetical protein [Verrucomicrobiota bacterium]